jgi:1-acyl-sn-glycerol-3-phosphate acyltransferase
MLGFVKRRERVRASFRLSTESGAIVTAEGVAILALALYALILVCVLAFQALRYPSGWVVWVLYVTERLYLGLFYRWRCNRRCPFPDHGPALIVANHRSPVDPLFLWMNHHLGEEGERAVRPISFLMAREYYEVKGLGWLFRALKSIPVDRSGQDVGPAREGLRVLKEGGWLGVFPEGRLNTGEGLLEGDTGIAWLALRAKAPVYPAFIENAPRGRSMVTAFCTPSKVRVIYGDPVDLSAYYERKKTQALLKEVTDLLMIRLAELGGIEYEHAAARVTGKSATVPLRERTGS